jgi:transmembrane sensor
MSSHDSHDSYDASTDPVDWTLLTRYVAGECPPHEAQAVEQWLAEQPVRRAYLTEARRLWDQAAALPPVPRIDTMWNELRSQMHRSEPSRLAADSLPSSRRRINASMAEAAAHRPFRVRWLSVALAAGVALAAVGVALRSWQDRTASMSQPPFEREYRTARGQRATVALADGSQVELGVDSKIRVVLYDNGRREVRLEGEAIFDVRHDTRRPFVVYAGDAITEDIGTRFGVRAYPEDRTVRVVVVEGEVALRPATPRSHGDTAAAVLRPKDLGWLDAEGAVRLRRGVDTDAYVGWTERRLVFRQATLAEIAAQLERWYDVEIVVRGAEIAAQRVTLDLAAPSLVEALDAIVVPLGLHYERTGSRVVIHS